MGWCNPIGRGSARSQSRRGLICGLSSTHLQRSARPAVWSFAMGWLAELGNVASQIYIPTNDTFRCHRHVSFLEPQRATRIGTIGAVVRTVLALMGFFSPVGITPYPGPAVAAPAPLTCLSGCWPEMTKGVHEGVGATRILRRWSQRRDEGLRSLHASISDEWSHDRRAMAEWPCDHRGHGERAKKIVEVLWRMRSKDHSLLMKLRGSCFRK